MHCYGCNTSVTKDQERCGSCGFPLKIVSGNCENFADVGAEYQNEWLKYQEEQTANASNKSLLPLIGVFLMLFVPASNNLLLKSIALNVSCFLYSTSLFL